MGSPRPYAEPTRGPYHRAREVSTAPWTFTNATLVLGGTGLDAHHADLPALVLVNNLLGGPAMNSRLNLHIRERHGIAYQIESFLNPYSDTGIWGIYAGTDEDAIDRCHRLILRELKGAS